MPPVTKAIFAFLLMSNSYGKASYGFIVICANITGHCTYNISVTSILMYAMPILLIVNCVNARNHSLVWLHAGYFSYWKVTWLADRLHSSYGNRLALSSDYQRCFSVIQTVLEQGKNLFGGKKVSNRIVNIDRHYLRLIIRGKETKFVEFGVKVNNIRIDGASFSFKAFSKGVRLKDWFIRNNNWPRLELRRLQRIQSMLIMPIGNFVLNII